MKTIKNTLGISLLVISFLFSGEIQGQKRNNSSNRNVKIERGVGNDNRVGSSHHRNDRYRTQPKHRNPSYRYPRHRRVVRTLPMHHIRLTHRGLPYFYYSGIYYTLYGNEYIVVMPPRGFRITVLPVGHLRIVVGPSVYFYHSGIYYTETTTTSSMESEGKYEVTQPPVGVVLSEIPDDAEKVNIDGKVLYEHNKILYKKSDTFEGETTYEVVYSKPNDD
jgi:hypothetical protein